MKNKEYKDFDIQSLFDCDNIEVPEKLSKWNVMSIINKKQIKQKKISSINFKKIVSIAACLIIVIIAAFTINSNVDVVFVKNTTTAIMADTDSTAQTTAPPDNTIPENALVTNETEKSVQELPDDYETITNHFKQLYANNAFNYHYSYNCNGVVDEGFTQSAATTVAAQSAVNDGSNNMATQAPTLAAPGMQAEQYATGEQAKDYSQTNTQYENIDEGDIIKNDGRYLYIVSGQNYVNGVIKIIDTQTMQVVYGGTVKCKDGTDAYIDQIFVSGDTLVVLCDKYNYNSGKEFTFSVVYDIADRTNPKIINTVTQDGGISSARMIGNVLYTLSSYNVWGTSETEVINNCVPKVNDEYVNLPCIFIEDDNSTSYVVLTAYDVTKNDKPNTVCVLGGGDGVYCSEKNFYAFNYGNVDGSEITKIIAFSINGTDIEFKTRGEVPGVTGGQYYFDEYNGFLRVATTVYGIEDKSNLYILDSELKQVSSLENIAHNEQVKSARFMGDRAYLVTFEQTDPLFTLDLSDPYNPKIMGELKLPGFSYYLHPVDENTLLGFGYYGTILTVDYSTVKISLFDISDFNNPKEVDSVVIKHASTELEYDEKALIYNAETKTYSIPVSADGYGYWENNAGSFISFKVADGKVEKTNEYKHNVNTGYPSFFRGAYIADKFYTVCDQFVVEYNLSTGKKLRSCEYLTEEDKRQVEITDYLAPGVTYGTTTPRILEETLEGTTTVPAYNPNETGELTSSGYNPNKEQTAAHNTIPDTSQDIILETTVAATTMH